MQILKEEINQASSDTLSLAKWKLVVVGVAAVASLGWSDVRPDSESGLLLAYSVGFLCAYVDWLYFHRLTIIHQIAAYLRDYDGDDSDMLELRAYERAMARGRQRPARLISQTWASFGATIIFSIGLPLLAMQAYGVDADWRLSIVALAVASNVTLFAHYQRTRRSLKP